VHFPHHFVWPEIMPHVEYEIYNHSNGPKVEDVLFKIVGTNICLIKVL
jgi:hypothetical protein